jgi:hypothetical protein
MCEGHQNIDAFLKLKFKDDSERYVGFGAYASDTAFFSFEPSPSAFAAVLRPITKLSLWDWFNALPLYLRCHLPRAHSHKLIDSGARKRVRTGSDILKMVRLKELIVSEIGACCIFLPYPVSSALHRAPRGSGLVPRIMSNQLLIGEPGASTVRSSGFLGRTACGASHAAVDQDEFLDRVFYMSDSIWKGGVRLCFNFLFSYRLISIFVVHALNRAFDDALTTWECCRLSAQPLVSF